MRFWQIVTFGFFLSLAYPSVGMAQQGAVSARDTVNAALKYGRGLKAYQENRQALKHEVRQAQAGWGPRIDATGSLGASRLSDTTTRPLGADKDMYGSSSVGVRLTQPLWDGLATRSRVRTAEASLEAMNSEVLDNASTLALNGLVAHITVLRQRELVRLAEVNVKRHQEILASTRDRVHNGADTQADVSQTQGRLSRAQSTLVEARADLLDAETNYRRLTGKAVPQSLDFVGLPMGMFSDARAVLEKANVLNPQLLASISTQKVQEGQRDLSKAAFHPQVNLEVGSDYTHRHGPGSLWTAETDVQGTLRWNLFNSGADVAATKAVEARVRKSRMETRDFVDTLKKEIDTYWTAYRSSIKNHELYLQAIDFNTRTRDAYIEQFFLGQRSLLDVLDAESELFNSSAQSVASASNVTINGYRLCALAGTLLETMNVDQGELVKDLPEPEDQPVRQ